VNEITEIAVVMRVMSMRNLFAAIAQGMVTRAYLVQLQRIL